MLPNGIIGKPKNQRLRQSLAPFQRSPPCCHVETLMVKSQALVNPTENYTAKVANPKNLSNKAFDHYDGSVEL